MGPRPYWTLLKDAILGLNRAPPLNHSEPDILLSPTGSKMLSILN